MVSKKEKFLNLYHTLSQINRLKRKELVLPIAKKEVVVSPLSIGDDLAIKTALVSPVRLDFELLQLLYRHTEFFVSEDELSTAKKRNKKKKEEIEKLGGTYAKPDESSFYSQISYFDKLVLMWGIYLITYGSLGERELECNSCEFKFKHDINLEDTIHDDSLTIFEPEMPFTDYIVPVELDLMEDYALEFLTRIPSMANYNQLMRLVTIEEIQSNLEKIRSQFSVEQLMALYTKKMSVVNKKTKEVLSESTNPQEIITSLRDHINIDLAAAFMRSYHDHFSKYNVNFYKNVECPKCKEVMKVGVDVEFEFFRRQFSN